MTTKQLNIKNRTNYFYNDLINILNFEASNLKLNKKTSMGLDIYYIGYVDKKPECNVNSVNPLYLMTNRIDGFIEEKNGVKYLNISDTGKNREILKKYYQVFDGIKCHIKKINDDSKYVKNYMKIKFNTDDDIPLNKELYFPTITVIIRCVFKKDGKYYPQVYLDECLIQYERIDINEGIDFNKTSKSLECMICHYWYFKDIGFKYQPYVCNGCHDFSMTVQNLSDFFIVTVTKVDYRCYIVGIDKKDAISLLNNSVLSSKGVL